MKKYIIGGILLLAVLGCTSMEASSQVVVRVRPAAPLTRLRPLAPSPRHIWIDGGWAYRGNGYVWTDGYWAVPRPGMIWVGGGWRHRRDGWVWMPGHWRRRF
jgi:hypothetical protein